MVSLRFYSLTLSCTCVRIRMYIFLLYYISIFNDGDARTIPCILEENVRQLSFCLRMKLYLMLLDTNELIVCGLGIQT